MLLGPTGARLWADYLDPVPGFAGRVDFIHKLNIPLLFSVLPEGLKSDRATTSSQWYPSHLHFEKSYDGAELREDKFITFDDTAVSVQHWFNRSKREINLRLLLPKECTRQEDIYVYNILDENHGLRLQVLIGASLYFSNGDRLTLPAGEEVFFVVASNVKPVGENGEALLRQTIAMHPDACLQRQIEDYDRWFQDVPIFESDDPLLNKTWWYRWFILRHCYAEPNCGLMKHGLFYEGRSHKISKTPFTAKGHEFSQLIPLSTPMHLQDIRWKNDTHEGFETIMSLLDSMDEKGNFTTLMIDRHGAVYGNYAQWALWEYLLVHPNIKLSQGHVEAFKKNFRTVLENQRTEADILPVCYDHRRTGKEYQPSFWYFTGFPDNAKDNTSFTPLKRVDLACCMYRNARGLEEICATIGDPDAVWFKTIADELRELVLRKMWDQEDGFFYDLHYATEEKARVRTVTGIDPLWAGMTGEKHYKVLDRLTDAKEFATGDCFSSCSAKSPVFMPQGSWKGHFFKGRNGCMWDGPSWPFATSVVLDTLASQSKKNGHDRDGLFGKFLREYSLEHYQGHDMKRPYLVEHYDCITGEPLSDEADYLHSFYIDLIVKHVVGIEPSRKGIIVDPIDIGLSNFSLTKLMIFNKRIDVKYDCDSGLSVFIDGKEQLKDTKSFPVYLAL